MVKPRVGLLVKLVENLHKILPEYAGKLGEIVTTPSGLLGTNQVWWPELNLINNWKSVHLQEWVQK